MRVNARWIEKGYLICICVKQFRLGFRSGDKSCLSTCWYLPSEGLDKVWNIYGVSKRWFIGPTLLELLEYFELIKNFKLEKPVVPNMLELAEAHMLSQLKYTKNWLPKKNPDMFLELKLVLALVIN